MTQPASLRDAALAYAARGFRVVPLHFPVGSAQDAVARCSCGDRACAAIGKHPLTPHGLNDATHLRAQVDWYWRRWPEANIGLLTGELVDVLDIDGPQGHAALSQWAAEHRLRLDGPLARSGRGWHYYLQASGARNRIGLLDHVDWRGRGGYVVAPPSRHANGRRYYWVRPLGSQLPPLPAELERLVLPPHPEPSGHRRFRPEAAGHPYGRKVLEQELASVAAAPRGTRNHALYQAGIRLYSLVAGGVLDSADVEAGLRNAAEACRLLEEEPAQTRRTLASAERTAWLILVASPFDPCPTVQRQPTSARRATERSVSAMPEPSQPKEAGRRDVPEQQEDEHQEPARGADRNRLPSDPVLRAVRRLACRRRQSLRQLLGPDLFVAYCNARVAGTINLVTLERFCDEVLGWHPRMLYGEAYDEAAFRPPDPP